MTLLDTNIVSELRKAKGGKADATVLAWAREQMADGFYLSAVTVQEIEFGILSVATTDPAKAATLRGWLEEEILAEFGLRILSYDIAVARACAALHLPRTRPQRDAMIAATALVHNLTLATRNVRDFAGTGVTVINPWDHRVGTGSDPE